MLRRTIALAMIAAAALPLSAASADHEPDRWGCPIHAGDASATTPNVTDPAGDWEGLILGNESAVVPAGDLYREGTDIVASWLAIDGDGNLSANVKVVDMLTDIQPNANFYVLWNYTGSDSSRARRWVSGRLKGYDVAFSYGYHGINPVTGNPTFFTEGETTGVIDPEADTVTIDVPKGGTTLSGRSNDDWGAPASGAVLDAVTAEARILVGSPEPLPPNPSNLRHGFVYEADTTANGSQPCGSLVP